MTSNGKQFTATREMLTAVARDQRWPGVLAGISPRFSKFAFVLFCYIKNHLMTGPLGNSESQCFPGRSSRETLRIERLSLTLRGLTSNGKRQTAKMTSEFCVLFF